LFCRLSYFHVAALTASISPEKSPPHRRILRRVRDEPFLKRLVLTELRHRVLGGRGDGEFRPPQRSKATRRKLAKCSIAFDSRWFGGGQRLVIIDDADEFVSGNRRGWKTTSVTPFQQCVGVEVSTWPATRAVQKGRRARSAGQLRDAHGALLKWLIGGPNKPPGKTRSDPRVVARNGGPSSACSIRNGKLASSAGLDGTITAQMITDRRWLAARHLTCSMRLRRQSRRGLVQPTVCCCPARPHRLLAQIGSTLRRFAAATRLVEQAETLASVDLRGLQRGLQNLAPAMQKLRPTPQLVRGPAQIVPLAARADLALKGSSSLPTSTHVLEQLVVTCGRAARQETATLRK